MALACFACLDGASTRWLHNGDDPVLRMLRGLPGQHPREGIFIAAELDLRLFGADGRVGGRLLGWCWGSVPGATPGLGQRDMSWAGPPDRGLHRRHLVSVDLPGAGLLATEVRGEIRRIYPLGAGPHPISARAGRTATSAHGAGRVEALDDEVGPGLIRRLALAHW